MSFDTLEQFICSEQESWLQFGPWERQAHFHVKFFFCQHFYVKYKVILGPIIKGFKLFVTVRYLTDILKM